MSHETAAEFLTERRDFLHVHVVPSVRGDGGWDVVVRVDGTYSSKLHAEMVVAAVRWRMENLQDVGVDGRTWWDGPPEWKSS